jgi:hypothetical protein
MRNTTKILVRRVCVPAEIRSECLPGTSRKRYHLGQLATLLNADEVEEIGGKQIIVCVYLTYILKCMIIHSDSQQFSGTKRGIYLVPISYNHFKI